MTSFTGIALAALALAACGAPGAREVEAPSGEPGPEGAQAIALARECWAREPWGVVRGFHLDPKVARAFSDVPSRARFTVRLHEGSYMGRLPPPHPAEEVWIEVDLTTKRCTVRPVTHE